tara:strand:- start:372 stop:1247 length:876 start_codon:yes stop_codon:yes gene_type:complete
MQKGYAVLLCVLMQIFALVSHVIVRTSHANDLAMRTQLTQRLLDLEGRTRIGRSDVIQLRQAAARAIAARASPVMYAELPASAAAPASAASALPLPALIGVTAAATVPTPSPRVDLVTSSSTAHCSGEDFNTVHRCGNVVNDANARWTCPAGGFGGCWVAVDLGSPQLLSAVRLEFEAAYSTSFNVDATPSSFDALLHNEDGAHAWARVAERRNGKPVAERGRFIDEINFDAAVYRSVKISHVDGNFFAVAVIPRFTTTITAHSPPPPSLVSLAGPFSGVSLYRLHVFGSE